MPWYMTECSAGSGNYGGQLYAANAEQAEETATRRGIGETVLSMGGKGTPFTRPSEWMRKPPSPQNDLDTFHSLCWFAHLALKSGTATADDLFGDRGVVHEWAHLRALGESGLGMGMDPDLLVEMVEDIERRIPGFLGSGDPDEWAQLIDIDEAIEKAEEADAMRER